MNSCDIHKFHNWLTADCTLRRTTGAMVGMIACSTDDYDSVHAGGNKKCDYGGAHRVQGEADFYLTGLACLAVIQHGLLGGGVLHKDLAQLDLRRANEDIGAQGVFVPHLDPQHSLLGHIERIGLIPRHVAPGICMDGGLLG